MKKIEDINFKDFIPDDYEYNPCKQIKFKHFYESDEEILKFQKYMMIPIDISIKKIEEESKKMNENGITPQDVIRLENKYGYLFTDNKLISDLIKLEKIENAKKENIMNEITENTTIGELIPKGYDIDPVNKEKVLTEINSEKSLLCIPLNKHQEKNFEWYVDAYMQKRGFLVPGKFINNTLEWDFEARIGLLKFICEYNKVNFILILADLLLYKKTGNELGSAKIIEEICPKKFLKSFE